MFLFFTALLGFANAAKLPHIIAILQDDLGWYDVAFHGNKDSERSTGNITSLAQEGVILDAHYTHWHCSPSRRTFLTGRLPLHHGEWLSGDQTDDIDLRWTWLSEKLKARGYKNYWYGKGHTGYRSMSHLPANRGFDDSTLYLNGAGSYTKDPRWNNEAPLKNNDFEYSTDFYGNLALQAVTQHNPSTPLFLYLPWQAVHVPYDLPPRCLQHPKAEDCDNNIRALVGDADQWMGRIVDSLKNKGMWDDTLIIFTPDNGGVTDGINYPQRGEKHTNWNGGMRTAAFLSGGFLPQSLRGTSYNGTIHIADWYPTICQLTGADPTDDPAVPPLPIDPSKPNQDIWQGNLSFPGVDGVNVWPYITGQSSGEPHASLWLSNEVIIQGKYKLLVAQPSPHLMEAKTINNGWKYPNGTWVPASDEVYGCNKYQDRDDFKPCLFDLGADPREEKNLADSMPQMVETLWRLLNTTNLGFFSSRSPDNLLGKCSPKCSKNHWGALNPGPECGVPGC